MNKEKTQYIIFLVALLLFCLAVSFIMNAPDYDLWARLLVGKHLLETGTFLKHDIFSYTPTHFWFDHEWGSSLIFYIVFKYFGGIGLTCLKAGLIFGILVLIQKTIELRADKKFSTTNIIYYLIILLSFINVMAATVRCHLFTFLFFTLWIYLLERVRKGEKKWLYQFPIMMVFWSNIHGGCISGMGLLVIYALGEFLDKKPTKDFVIAIVTSSLAMLINPYGFEYVLFLLKATTMNRPLITEWKGSFDKAYLYSYIKFKIFFFISLWAIALKIAKEKISYIKADKTKIILLCVTAFLAISHIKHQPFFVITAAIFLYEDFLSILSYLLKRPMITTARQGLISYVVVIIASLMLIEATPKAIPASPQRYPLYAVEFIKQNDLKGNLFINFTYGSYAAYKLYPKNLIVMDGRYEEVYYDDLLYKLRDFHMIKGKNWKNIITDYKTDVLVLEQKYPVYKKIQKDKDWKLIFDDGKFGVFVPTKTAKNKYTHPTPNLEYYTKTNFDSPIVFKKG